jgi:hypothetical protein
LDEVYSRIVVYLLHLLQDYIHTPARREVLLDTAQRFIVRMFAGGYILQS